MGDPSPELDALWESEYDLISRIPETEANRLEQHSDEFIGDPGHYPVVLDIFHSIHCLNDIRMTLNVDYYGLPHMRKNLTAEYAKMHLEHCIEHLRLALWCGADVSPISFQDLGTARGLIPIHGYSHTCRDREAILAWARENKVHGWPDRAE